MDEELAKAVSTVVNWQINPPREIITTILYMGAAMTTKVDPAMTPAAIQVTLDQMMDGAIATADRIIKRCKETPPTC